MELSLYQVVVGLGQICLVILVMAYMLLLLLWCSRLNWLTLQTVTFVVTLPKFDCFQLEWLKFNCSVVTCGMISR